MVKTENGKIAKAGTFLMLTSGAWDNFGLDGMVRVIVDFDPLQSIADFKARMNTSVEFEKDFHAFIEYVEKAGLVVLVPNQVLYLGDYGIDASSAKFD